MCTMATERLRVTVLVPLLVCLALCHVSTDGARIAKRETIVVGSMGENVTLPGFLKSREDVFVHDGKPVSPDARLYRIEETSTGYQITVRYLTCTDEGTYTLGGITFVLTAKPGGRGLFSFLARVESRSYAVSIKPLRDVVRIFSVNANGDAWTLNQVWNCTTNRNEIPGDYYHVTNDGTEFVGYGDERRSFFVYQRRGRPEQACVDFAEASNVSPTNASPLTGVEAPTLESLKTIDTRVDLESVDVQQSIDDLIEAINKLKASNGLSPMDSHVLVPTLIFCTMWM